MSFADTIIENVRVRRHNGHNPYGPWVAVRDESVPAWVGDMIGDEIAEHDADEGRINRGGSEWVWHKV